MQFSVLELYVIPSIQSVDIMESGLTQKESHPEQHLSSSVLEFVESLEFQDEGKHFSFLHRQSPLSKSMTHIFFKKRIAFSSILEEYEILEANVSQGSSAIPKDNTQPSAILKEDTVQGSAILKKEKESHTETGLF